MILLLSRLALHYYRPDFTEGQAKLLILDMASDLDPYTAGDVEVAIGAYRRNSANKFFPRSGDIIEVINTIRKARREAEADVKRRPAVPGNHAGKRYPDDKSRPAMWWMLPRAHWKPSWRESEAPDDGLVYDAETGARRKPYRFS